jgi:hypothetical protein
MVNRKFTRHYTNSVTVITDALEHKTSLSVLNTKVKAGLLKPAVLAGYRDAVAGVYDKHWRYNTSHESHYLRGVQAAINNGAVINTYLDAR